jgi:multiple sugar transport system ATP-binding protein
MATLSFRNVTKTYPNGVAVIHGIDMDVRDGEFIVIVGPSGCGKSTLMRMVAGLESITGGEISIGDKVVNRLEPAERDIAMVFQNYALYPHMSVFDNMAYGLKIRKLPKAEIQNKVQDAARILELSHLLDRRPGQLSGGQRQRVAMGRAIVRNPQVFLFDEPLSNLDAKLRVQMRTEIKALHQRLKTTTVYVTHDQIEAMTMADRIVVMHGGIVEQIGTPLDLYDRPVNLFVAGFIGSPAMNFLSGRIAADGSKTFMTDDGVSLPLTHVPDGHAGCKAIYGVRPEHFVLGAAEGVPFAVEVIEPTGSETHVFGKIGGKDVVGVFRERIDVRPGQTISVAPAADSIHLFDADTERRLVARAETVAA